MIIRCGDRYLELNELIEVERKVKLFEDISATEGDFSYSFSIPKNQNNEEIVSIFNTNNQDRPWNRKIPADLLNDSGDLIHSGFIRIEKSFEKEYSASFYSGNSNWIDELNYSLIDIDWSSFNPTGTFDFTSTSGVVTPLVDNGLLSTRKSPAFSSEDFVPFIYVKDVIKRVLTLNGMKLEGSILNDPIYNKLLVSFGNGKLLQKEIDKRTVFVGKSGTQTITSSYSTITFTNVSTPYYNSPLGNWDTSTNKYVFDITAKEATIEVDLKFDIASFFDLRIFDGTNTLYSKSYAYVKYIKEIISSNNFKYPKNLPSAGGYISVQVRLSSAFWANRTMVAGSTIKVIPNKFFQTFAASVVPNMTASDFLSNVFRMLNMVVSYKNVNKTLVVENLDNVLKKEPVDLSEYLTISDSNFEELVSGYGKINIMLWGEQSNDSVEEFNSQNVYPYASGVINIDNDFLEDQSEIVEMDINAPFQSTYSFLGLDLPRTDFLTYRPIETRNLTSVSEDTSTGVSLAQFNFDGSGGHDGIIRISESTIEDYNGDYFWPTAGGSFAGLVAYLGNATGKVEFMETSIQESDPVFILNNPNLLIGNVSAVNFFYAGNLAQKTTVSVGNFLRTDNFKLSLSFSDLKQSHFSKTEKLLNNGVKSYASGNIPESVYKKIDFLSTIKINDMLFYPNLISGYKGSKYPVTFELIKI